ncbi:hypothetical protein N9R04_05810 [Staphylococcus sp. SQ8-PEA]|uniref:Teichoic acid translocation permease protein TagG n=1 Tax=Staphylococcus marylandisciuri TaxID=2981529 RepID=A0ABT2QQJ0_9STAP|nr:hypothetical protein [Staphylococcus marylandisciuri]MCU5746236.1 hypothetical protein [Staphylococcus marylandisciuri]
MIDHLINFYKTLPNLWSQAVASLKRQWKYIVASIALVLLLFVILLIVLQLTGITEIVQARWYYRLTGFSTFTFVFCGIYLAFKNFNQDYIIFKSFKMSPYFQIILIAVLYSVIQWIVNTIIMFSTSINIDNSSFGILFYALMSILFIDVVASILGLLSIISKNIEKIFYVIIVLTFILSPILYIPNSNASIWTHLMMLNPVCYLVKGSAEANVIGLTSVSNIPYHIYFLSLVAVGYVVVYALNRFVAHQKYNIETTTKVDTRNKANANS